MNDIQKIHFEELFQTRKIALRKFNIFFNQFLDHIPIFKHIDTIKKLIAEIHNLNHRLSTSDEYFQEEIVEQFTTNAHLLIEFFDKYESTTKLETSDVYDDDEEEEDEELALSIKSKLIELQCNELQYSSSECDDLNCKVCGEYSKKLEQFRECVQLSSPQVNKVDHDDLLNKINKLNLNSDFSPDWIEVLAIAITIKFLQNPQLIKELSDALFQQIPYEFHSLLSNSNDPLNYLINVTKQKLKNLALFNNKHQPLNYDDSNEDLNILFQRLINKSKFCPLCHFLGRLRRHPALECRFIKEACNKYYKSQSDANNERTYTKNIRSYSLSSKNSTISLFNDNDMCSNNYKNSNTSYSSLRNETLRKEISMKMESFSQSLKIYLISDDKKQIICKEALITNYDTCFIQYEKLIANNFKYLSHAPRNVPNKPFERLGTAVIEIGIGWISRQVRFDVIRYLNQFNKEKNPEITISTKLLEDFSISYRMIGDTCEMKQFFSKIFYYLDSNSKSLLEDIAKSSSSFETIYEQQIEMDSIIMNVQPYANGVQNVHDIFNNNNDESNPLLNKLVNSELLVKQMERNSSFLPLLVNFNQIENNYQITQENLYINNNLKPYYYMESVENIGLFNRKYKSFIIYSIVNMNENFCEYKSFFFLIKFYPADFYIIIPMEFSEDTTKKRYIVDKCTSLIEK